MTLQNQSDAKDNHRIYPVGRVILLSGIAITTVWLITCATYAWFRRAEFVSLKPNEIGDTLAGCFAPLAFAWLALAVFLQRLELVAQRVELTLNRDALRQQVQELSRSVSEQQRQANLMTQQVQERHSLEVSISLERMADRFIDSLPPLARTSLVTLIRGQHGGEERTSHYLLGDPAKYEALKGSPIDPYLRELCEHLAIFQKPIGQHAFEIEPDVRDKIIALLDRLSQAIVAMLTRAEELQPLHLDRFPVPELAAARDSITGTVNILKS
jgi:hypothetical protein